jgi:hypothetical protein
MPESHPPKTNTQLEQIETLASIGCTLREIASVVGLSQRVLNRREKSEGFFEAIERGRDAGKASLRRMQWQAAQKGNVTALIWLGKQMLGQRSFEHEEKKGPEAVEIPPFIVNCPHDPTLEPS